MNPFTRHPSSVGESYAGHCRVATHVGVRMVLGGLGAIVHGFVPFLFTTTGSRTIAALHAEIVAKRDGVRVDEEQMRTVEFVI